MWATRHFLLPGLEVRCHRKCTDTGSRGYSLPFQIQIQGLRLERTNPCNIEAGLTPMQQLLRNHLSRCKKDVQPSFISVSRKMAQVCIEQ